jgi:hypothetical protein
MKNTKKLLVLLLTALLICVSVFTATASVIPPVTETYAGETVLIDFSYDNIAGIHGTFTTTGDDIIESIEIVPDSDFTGTQNNNVIAFYKDSADKFVANIKVVVKADAKKGDECKVVFEYETTENGKLPTTPSYEYEEAIIKIVLDYTELDKQLDDAKTYEGKEDKYTADSWDAFIKAWEAAKKAHTDAKIQKEVDDAAKALKDAIAALELKPVVPGLDYTELDKQLADAKTYEGKEDKYTTDSWNAFVKAWEDGKKAREEATTQKELDDAAKALKDAIAALKEKPTTPAETKLDYTELEKLIKKAGKLKEKRYTPESWANMLQVLADAKALICNAETQEEIDAMVDSLAAAIDALVPVDKSPSTEGVVMLLPLFLIIAALVVLFVYASKRKTDKATSK